MKRFYYNLMQDVTEHIGWNLFIFNPYGTGHGRFLQAAQDYNRKLVMLDHPSNAKS